MSKVLDQVEIALFVQLNLWGYQLRKLLMSHRFHTMDQDLKRNEEYNENFKFQISNFKLNYGTIYWTKT